MDKTKNVEVTISVCLSTTTEVEVPEDFDESDLEYIVREQVKLPQDYLEIYGDYSWYVDEFCVSL